MSKLNVNLGKTYFNLYVNSQRKAIINNNDQEIAKKKLASIEQKVVHTEEILIDGTVVSNGLNFNESFLALQQFALLNHDIGRFLQMRYLGTYDDFILEKSGIFGVSNHGQLGKIVLESGILKKQIPDTRVYDYIILESVTNHVTNVSEDSDLSLLTTNLFQNEDTYELLQKCDAKIKKQILSVITQIVQDVDKLDIYHQILSDREIPLKNDLEIDSKVFDMFYNGEYLNMAKLKEANLWNANVGDLLRLGFVNQLKLLSVAKMILEEDLIMKMKEKRQNRMVKDAYDFQQHKLEEMIRNSEDGITVSKVLVKR